MLRWLLPALLACAPAAAQEASPPSSGEPAGLFDRLFGMESGPRELGDGPGEDGLSIVALVLGRSTLNNALPAFEREDGLCVPATELLDSLEIAHAAVGEDIEIRLVAPARTVRIAASDLQPTPLGRCVTLAALGRAIPARLDHDRENLRILVSPEEPFPVVLRLEREERRANIDKAPDSGPALPAIANPWRAFSYPALDVAYGMAVQDGRATSTASIEASGELLGLSMRLRTGLDADGRTTLRTTLSRASEAGDLLGQLGVRGIQFGDVVAPALPMLADSATGRGLVVTSRPAWAADLFDAVDIIGPLPPGWDAELYRDSRLMAVVTAPDADGNYRFVDVPLRVGANRYVVKLFGPRGEQDERVFIRVIGRELHPENETYLTIGVIEPGVPLVGRRATLVGPPAAFATVERGLSGTLSARVDVRVSSRFQAASAGLHAAVMGGSASMVVGTDSGGQPPVGLRLARRFGGTDLTLALADHGDRAGPEAPVEMQEARSVAALDAATRLPLGRRSAQVQLRLSHTRSRSGIGIARLDTATGLALGETRISNRLGIEQRQGADGRDIRADGSFGIALPLPDWRLRGIADYQLAPGLSLQRMMAVAARSTPDSLVQAEAGWDWTTGTPNASLAVTRYLGPVSISARAGVAGRGWSAGVALGVSLYRATPAGGGPLFAGYGFGRPGFSRTAAIRPIVFVDDNGDGLPGPGEDRVADARFLVDSSLRTETTGIGGTSLIGGLSPGRPISVEPQLASLPDLSLRPVRPGATAILRPGQVLDIPVPLVPTGEVEVRVLARAGDRDVPLAGVRVRLIHGDGQSRDAASDYDGYAYFDGLPFGRWRLDIPSRPDVAGREIVLGKDNPSALGRTLLVAPTGATGRVMDSSVTIQPALP
jgi:hypothetical protein